MSTMNLTDYKFCQRNVGRSYLQAAVQCGADKIANPSRS
jgi:hypothetical protein